MTTVTAIDFDYYSIVLFKSISTTYVRGCWFTWWKIRRVMVHCFKWRYMYSGVVAFINSYINSQSGVRRELCNIKHCGTVNVVSQILNVIVVEYIPPSFHTLYSIPPTLFTSTYTLAVYFISTANKDSF